ncbi:MAG: hypothetical protein IPI29_09960 [Ignavibacteria bacterium]|nr:hypothetical protein [Ignavibacteria bacterium]
MKYFALLLVSLAVVVSFNTQPLLGQDEKAMRKKCAVSVTWTWRGEDATTVVTVKNATKKTLVDPVVRVRFYNKEGAEVSTDAKGLCSPHQARCVQAVGSTVLVERRYNCRDCQGRSRVLCV